VLRCPTNICDCRPTILLNHLSAPNCIIWSAILASAAVPGILPPIVLMAKDANGKAKPYNLAGARFKDGSLRYVAVRLYAKACVS
jgi:predicted acylesterase/phospholipase RssA